MLPPRATHLSIVIILIFTISKVSLQVDNLLHFLDLNLKTGKFEMRSIPPYLVVVMASTMVFANPLPSSTQQSTFDLLGSWKVGSA